MVDIRAAGLVKSFDLEKRILDGLSFQVDSGERVGLLGRNGAGKTTVFRMLTGELEPDEGEIQIAAGRRVGLISQIPVYPEGCTVEDVLQTAFARMFRMKDEMDALALRMEQGDSSEATLRRYGELNARFEGLGGWDTETAVNKVANGLNIPQAMRAREFACLSGGEKTRVNLGRLILEDTDILLLDEPTNHLDAEMIGWLETYLQKFSGGILLVTHDRYFLERVADRTAELSFGKLYLYEGGYSAYLEGRARREEMEAASERKRQSTLRRELQWVLQGPCARGTKSRERLERYEKLKAAQPPELEQSLGPIQALSSRLGRKTVELTGVGKAFDGKWVLRDFDFLLQRDDRVGIVGGNGAGKSTLLNLIAGYITPDTGTVTLGDTVKLGYFSQHGSEMNPNMTALDYVKEQGDRIETPEGTLTASKLMDKFLFSGPMQHRLIGKLSGGERRRLFLLGILASAPNVLLLDEPTNDLDIPTMTVLEEYLTTFPGAIIAVSHDRYFLDKLCKRIFALEPGGSLRQYPGGYTDYLASLTAPKEKKVKAAEAPRPKPKKLKFSFKEQREYETIDADIAALEARLEENKSAQDRDGADYEKLQQLMQEQQELEETLEEKTERWMYLTDLAERIQRGE